MRETTNQVPRETGTTDALSSVEILQKLIRFDTSNPPGGERACLEWIAGVLAGAGVPSSFLARDAKRPNLVARVPGRGEAPPLLLYGHVDVVPATNQQWSRDPYGAELDDGIVWGRGALDMKGGVAILLGAILDLRRRRAQTAGDLILALTSDEETGSELGAAFLVSEHAALFEDVRYAISEIGGFTQHIAGRRFYPIQVAEKSRCHLRGSVTGPGGHASAPAPGGTAAKLAKLLHALDRRHLPVHVTPVVRDMLGAMASRLPAPQRAALRPLLVPALTNATVRILGKDAEDLNPLLRNTATVVAIHGGEWANVIPSLITVEVDGRLVPGQTAADLVHELDRLAPGAVAWDIVHEEPPARRALDLSLLPMLGEALQRADPEGTPFPILLPGVTDARFFAQLGIQTYGFLPMRLPAEITTRLIHAADERVPADAIDFGVRVLVDVLERYDARW